MKRVSLLILLLFVLSPISSFAQQKMKAPDNFRGIKWGTDIKTLSGFKDSGWVPNLIPEYKDVKRYRRDENKKVGEIKVDGIEYAFYKGKFYAGCIFFKDANKYSILKDALEQKYGKGKKFVVEGAKEFENCFRWDVGDIDILISYTKSEGVGRLKYEYKPIDSECMKEIFKHLDKKEEKQEKVIRKLKDDL